MVAQVESVRARHRSRCKPRRAAKLSCRPAVRATLSMRAVGSRSKAERCPGMAAGRSWQQARVTSVCTIGIRSIEEYERRARELASYRWLKIKVICRSGARCVAAVRRGAPAARLVVDPESGMGSADACTRWRRRSSSCASTCSSNPCRSTRATSWSPANVRFPSAPMRRSIPPPTCRACRVATTSSTSSSTRPAA